MRKNNSENFDVVVIGGGPAGIMAAGRAAELGAEVALLEKNSRLGKKLLITGKGRCNITRAESNNNFIREIGKNGKFLFSSMASFDSRDVTNFFKNRNLKTKIERGKRIFPATDKSQDVVDVLAGYLKDNDVKVMFGKKVLGFGLKRGKIEFVKVKNGKLYANFFILCTGGKSYPVTGSTGDGYAWAKQMGHTIVKTSPSLVPLRIKEDWVSDIQGLSLKNIQINIFQNNKKHSSKFGEMLFTHFGVSGPIILNTSKLIGNLLLNGDVSVGIDLKPALDFADLEKRFLRDFSKNNNKNFKNYLPDLLPQKLIDLFAKLSGIDPGKKINSITKKERKKIIILLKDFRLTVDDTMGYNQAIVTSGGVDLKEVDSKTMRSKVVENLFLAGEILDLDGPTGGYNLQICWSTGYAAGTHSRS